MKCLKEFDEVKQNQYRTMFFSLKILALFFCATPLFKKIFSGQTTTTFYGVNSRAFITMLIILVALTFLWLIMDYNRKKLKLILFIEILVFYSVCVFSIFLSGSYQSYYKFLFIFMIVSYSIEFGIKVGVSIAVASSFTIIGIDLFFYKGVDVNQYFQTDLALSAMFIVVAWIMGYYVKIEKQHIADLKEYANLDGLTEVFNHRYFQEVFKLKCEESIEKKCPISLLMVDIDYFKNYNDLYGHQQGDEVLKIIANIIRDNVSKEQIVCRYGGEEFSVILPNMSQNEAVILSDNLRKLIANYEFYGREHMPNRKVTVSIGISMLYDEKDSNINVINRADAALYRAKYFRKNRVETYVSLFDKFIHLENSKDTADQSVKSMKTLITLINSRDRYTYNHTERVVYFCEIFAKYLRLGDAQKKNLLYGAYLHDIGKINISKEILISDKKLSSEEWEELKKHSIDSANIIRSIEGLEDVVDIVLQHHEKYDGSGYPNGVKGEEINYLARILTLVDSFDAMTNNRPYKEKLTYKEAFVEIQECSGKHFDPILAKQFIEALNNSK